MIEFKLDFDGYVDGMPYRFTYTRTFDELPHELQEGSAFLVVGPGENDDVSLVVAHMDLVQDAGALSSSIAWRFDSSPGKRYVDELGVQKIQRVLEFNGWSCEFAPI